MIRKFAKVLAGTYATAYGVLYFWPELVHKKHNFRATAEAMSSYSPNIIAHRGGMLSERRRIGSMELQENTLPAFENAVSEV